MISEESKKWIEAAKQFITNPNVIIKCPECNNGTLKINDAPMEPWNKIDRYVICDNCGKYNIITMSKPNQKP
jgi:hypothetical protein